MISSQLATKPKLPIHFGQQLNLPIPHELIIDNFAGGGGTSTGLEEAFGRPVDIAINHDPEALAMHALNHPYTRHLCESVWDVDPIEITGGRPVGLVWLSPDCKHFSKAKGKTPVSREIRGLAWVGMRWVALTKPRVLMLENVEEFQTWGPVIVNPDGSSYPDPKRKGKTFKSFVRQLRQHGYQVDWREMRACDNGAPTIRKRLFLVARRDGLPIVWPEQTHGDPMSREVLAGMLAPYRTAAECIDFDIPAISIFERKKDLAPNTQRRVAKGLWRHVLTSQKPFIVTNTSGHPGASINAPLPTIATGGHHMLGQPNIAPFTAGAGGPEYAGRPASVDQPMGTSTTENHRAIVSPVLTPIFRTPAATNSRPHDFLCTSCGNTFPSWRDGDEHVPGTCPSCGRETGICAIEEIDDTVMAPFLTEHANASSQRTMPADEPMRTLCAQVKGGHFSVVAPTLAPLRGTSEAHLGGHDIKQPLSTISAGGTHHALIAAHLTHLTHHGDRAGSTPAEPLPTVTGAHRGEQAMVAAHLVDIGATGNPDTPTGAFLEQGMRGSDDGDGRPANVPPSPITATGDQRLASAYLVKYYSSGGQWQGMADPMHTLPTKGRMGLVQTIQVPLDSLSPEQREKAKKCAELLHTHMPERFPEPAELVLMGYGDAWWVLVDITLRMLKARELYRAQSFPDGYIIHEIPNPELLFKDGIQVPGDPRDIPRIPLSATAQIRMCGNSVTPVQAKALVQANFRHEEPFRQVA